MTRLWQRPRAPAGARRLLGWATLVAVAAAACARVRPLEGGPPDKEPPGLVAVEPADSTVNLPRLARFRLDWSELLSTNAARAGVRIVPAVRIADVRVHGTRMTVTLAESLPPDTTVVLVLSEKIQDRPGRDNPLHAEIPLVYSTGPVLRGAAVLGLVRLKGSPEPHAVVVWQPVGPDSAVLRQKPGPVAAADVEGLFRLLGIPAGRPFRLRAFVDRNDNLYPDEGEIVNVYPETLQLGPGQVRRGIDWNLVDPKEPGEVRGVVTQRTGLVAPIAVALGPTIRPPSGTTDTTAARAETLAVRADTLRPQPLPVVPRDSTAWGAAYAALEPRGFVRREWVVVYASPRGDYSVRVPPGRHARIAFVDARRDSAPGLYVVADSTRLDWEPLAGPDTLVVPPGGTVRAPTLEIRPP